jgi:putative glutamine amidotransferase
VKRRSLASRGERPLIGVTTSELRPAERVTPLPEGEPRGTEMALGLPYLKGIEAAGGLPLVVPPMPEAAIEPLLDRLDGLCLSGGPTSTRSTTAPSRTPSWGRPSPTSTASSWRSPAGPTTGRCRSSRSAAAPRR